MALLELPLPSTAELIKRREEIKGITQVVSFLAS